MEHGNVALFCMFGKDTALQTYSIFQETLNMFSTDTVMRSIRDLRDLSNFVKHKVG